MTPGRPAARPAGRLGARWCGAVAPAGRGCGERPRGRAAAAAAATASVDDDHVADTRLVQHFFFVSLVTGRSRPSILSCHQSVVIHGNLHLRYILLAT